jgi:hypothetical protein
MQKLLMLILFMSISCMSFSQITHKYYYLKNGTVISENLSNIHLQAHGQDSLYIVLTNTTILSIALSDLNYYNYAGVTSTQALEKDSQPIFKVYPNPVSGMINVSYTLSKTDEISIGLYDINGRELMNIVRGNQSEGEYLETIQIGKYPTGVYFLKLQGSEYLSTQKLIINH